MTWRPCGGSTSRRRRGTPRNGSTWWTAPSAGASPAGPTTPTSRWPAADPPAAQPRSNAQPQPKGEVAVVVGPIQVGDPPPQLVPGDWVVSVIVVGVLPGRPRPGWPPWPGGS